MKEAKQYQGIEREQTFVKRYALNPEYTGGQRTLPGGLRIDHRRFTVTPEWGFCVRRHKEHWLSEGEPTRSVPMNYRHGDTGEDGWWFPAVWVQEFAASRRRKAA